MLHLQVEEKFFAAIKSGKKRIEGRLGKNKYLSLQEGDKICFSVSALYRNEVLICQEKNAGRKIESLQQICEITKVSYYLSFKEMLEKEELSAVLPEISSIEEGVAVYRDFYSEKDEITYGVAAISFLKLVASEIETKMSRI